MSIYFSTIHYAIEEIKKDIVIPFVNIIEADKQKKKNILLLIPLKESLDFVDNNGVIFANKGKSILEYIVLFQHKKIAIKLCATVIKNRKTVGNVLDR